MGFTFKILLRTYYVRKTSNQSSIVCRITINRKIKYYQLTISTSKENWSENNLKVKCSDPHCSSKNKVIENWKERLNELYFKYKKSELAKNLEFDSFERDFFQTKSISQSFYKFIIDEIELLKSLRDEGTIKNYSRFGYK